MALAKATFLALNPDSLTYQIIREGDEIPDWALEKVTNPDILGDGEEAVVDFDTGDVTVEQTEGHTGDDNGDTQELQGGNEGDDGVDLPNGSWKKAEIVDFLDERGVELTGSETKDDLLALVHGED